MEKKETIEAEKQRNRKAETQKRTGKAEKQKKTGKAEKQKKTEKQRSRDTEKKQRSNESREPGTPPKRTKPVPKKSRNRQPFFLIA